MILAKTMNNLMSVAQHVLRSKITHKKTGKECLKSSSSSIQSTSVQCEEDLGVVTYIW